MMFYKKLSKTVLLLSIVTHPVFANEDIEKFKHSWLGKTLQWQREIDLDVPLNQATFIGTHNSYNAKAYQIPFVRYIDPNQIYSLYDQLEMGARSLELDAHWTLSAKGKDILLCHGQDNHLGCSVFDKTFVSGLQELQDWLIKNPNEVVLLYIERHIDGHEPRLTAELDQYLGRFIYKPIHTGDVKSCVSLPSETLTKADILKSGKQVLIVTKGCEDSSGQEQDQFKLKWNDYVFAGIGHMPNVSYTFLDSTYDKDVTKFPDCSHSTVFVADQKHTSLWRLYDDLTVLSSFEKPTHKITADEMRDMVQCNINWQAMDMMDLDDARLAAAIWSWAPGYPKNSNNHCVIYKKDAGIEDVPCLSIVTAYACKNKKSQDWKVSITTGKVQDGESICQETVGESWDFATPVNGAEMYSIKRVMNDEHLEEVAL